MANVQDQAFKTNRKGPFMLQRTIALRPYGKGFIMTANHRTSGFGRFIGTIGSAIVVASAVEAGRRPFAQDLAALGIDPRQFTKIRRL